MATPIAGSPEVICRLEVRQSEKTKVTSATRDVFLIVQGNAATPPDTVQAGHDRLAGRFPDRPVVQAQFRQDVTGMEPEVLGDEGAFLRRGIIRSTGIGGEYGKR